MLAASRLGEWGDLAHEASWGDTGLGILAGALVGVTGALVGALIGSAIKTDRWEEVSLERLRVNLTPRPDGRSAFGLSFAF